MKLFENSLRYALSIFVVVSAAFASSAHTHDAAQVTYTAREGGFEGPDEIVGGFVRVTLQNETEHGIELQIMRLLREATDEEIIAAIQGIMMAHEPEDHAEATRTVLELAEMYGGPGFVGPETGRQSSSAVVELDEGEYALAAFGMTEAGESLPSVGFLTRLNVTAPTQPAQAPQADLTVQMVDFAFAFPPNIQAGAQTWEIVNRGEQPHHLILMTFQPGTTMADLQAWMEAGQAGPPPVMPVDATTVLTADRRMFVNVELEPGSYLAACFIHDPETGQPHVDLGMLTPFTVEGDEAEGQGSN